MFLLYKCGISSKVGEKGMDNKAIVCILLLLSENMHFNILGNSVLGIFPYAYLIKFHRYTNAFLCWLLPGGGALKKKNQQ